MNPGELSISDFTYDLPEDRIAMHPLADRDSSKLLVYREGQITDSIFSQLPSFIKADSIFVFNNTRVINARLKFQKKTGAAIEIFLLEPWGNVSEYNSVMSTNHSSTWKCMVGGAAKWKEEILEKEIITSEKKIMLNASLIERTTEAFIVKFTWEADTSFAEIIEYSGEIPLPPYIKREREKKDLERYQTIFASQKGSVAAPTAGLHFTEAVFEKLREKNIQETYVTLHVGAGTFKPVKALSMKDHEMHAEYIDVNRQAITELISDQRSCVAVGTTALRTIESIYWLGVKALLNPEMNKPLLRQWDVYEDPIRNTRFTRSEALSGLLDWMEKNNLQNIFTQTQLMIAPGYRFRMADALVTNFHQPQSTLLLLVAAAIGPAWKKLYEHALQNEYRFLSYGDANLVFIQNKQAEGI